MTLKNVLTFERLVVILPEYFVTGNGIVFVVLFRP